MCCTKIIGFCIGFILVQIGIVAGATHKVIFQCPPDDTQCRSAQTACIIVNFVVLALFTWGLLWLRRLVQRSDNMRFYQISLKISWYCMCGFLQDIPPETNTYIVTTTYGDGRKSVKQEERTTFFCLANLIIGLFYGALMPILCLYLWGRMIHAYFSPVYPTKSQLENSQLQNMDSIGSPIVIIPNQNDMSNYNNNYPPVNNNPYVNYNPQNNQNYQNGQTKVIVINKPLNQVGNNIYEVRL